MTDFSVYKGKKVFVTGAHGFIGSHLVSELKAAGAEVAVCVTDLLQGEPDLAEYGQPEYIFHLAAVSPAATDSVQERKIIDDNVLMLTKILHFAELVRAKVLLVSSSHVYPKITERGHSPLSEDEVVPGKALSVFGLSKQTCEARALDWARKSALFVVIVRLPNIYGPGDRSNRFVPTFIRKCLAKKIPLEVMGNGEVVRDFMYVTDAVRGLLLAMMQLASGTVINIGSGAGQTMAEIAETVRDAAGLAGEPISYLDPSASAYSYNVLDSSRAQRELGFFPEVPLSGGVQQTIAWWQNSSSISLI